MGGHTKIGIILKVKTNKTQLQFTNVLLCVSINNNFLKLLKNLADS